MNDPIDTTKTMWTLAEGIDLCRAIEKEIIPAGYHCALGGGVLMRGESGKDLDIFIYPHNGKKLNPALVRPKLALVGCKSEFAPGHSENPFDSKTIELWSYKNKWIDFFFVQ